MYYIQSNVNSGYNVSMRAGKPNDGAQRSFWKKIKQKALDIMPSGTHKDTKSTNDKKQNVDSLLSRPEINRAIMGATALVTQPAIDMANHDVDKDTREIARNRTIAKIIAGTAVGILVRGGCFRLVTKMTNPKAKSEFEKALIPKKKMKDFLQNETYQKNYRNVLASLVAVCVMLFTNFLLDAPLTTFLTNRFNKKTQGKKELMKQKKQEVNAYA